MGRISDQDGKENAGIGTGTLLTGALIFAMAATLLFGNAALYELKQENGRQAAELEAQRQILNALHSEAGQRPDPETRLRQLGLTEVDPAKVEVLHVRDP